MCILISSADSQWFFYNLIHAYVYMSFVILRITSERTKLKFRGIEKVALKYFSSTFSLNKTCMNIYIFELIYSSYFFAVSRWIYCFFFLHDIFLLYIFFLILFLFLPQDHNETFYLYICLYHIYIFHVFYFGIFPLRVTMGSMNCGGTSRTGGSSARSWQWSCRRGKDWGVFII